MAVDARARPLRGQEREGIALSAEEYERVALGESDANWELWDGRLREKPGMSVSHGRSLSRLVKQLMPQLDERLFEIRINGGHLYRAERSYFVPDLFVVAASDVAGIEDAPGVLETYRAPMALVVEIWSQSTGRYDIDDKLPAYQERGDLEIWWLHPYEWTLTIWRRLEDGGYARSVLTGGSVEPVALPGVTVDLDAVFA